MLGLDVTAQLIGEAREAGGSDFSVISCENIAAGRLKASVDQAVCNFALLGKESVANLVLAIPSLLNGRGARVVQALYPVKPLLLRNLRFDKFREEDQRFLPA